jgi:hypothetical protein
MLLLIITKLLFWRKDRREVSTVKDLIKENKGKVYLQQDVLSIFPISLGKTKIPLRKAMRKNSSKKKETITRCQAKNEKEACQGP